jgi:hypothetical protein
VGNANHIRIEKNRLIGSPAWEHRQHLAYVASTSVNDIVFKWNTFDGKGCACAGLLNFYHDPNAAGVRVYGNNIRNGDQGIVAVRRGFAQPPAVERGIDTVRSGFDEATGASAQPVVHRLHHGNAG